MLFVSLLTILGVAFGGAVDVDLESAFSLVWANSDSLSTSWTAATCDRYSGKNLVASDSSFHTFVSKDFGLNYSMAINPDNLGFYSLTSDGTGQFIAAGTQTSGVYFSKDFGKTWKLSYCPLKGDFYSLGSSLKVGSDGSAWTVIAVGLTSNVYMTRNTGLSWVSISPATMSTGGSYGYGIGVSNAADVIQVTYTDPTAGTTFYYSTDSGKTWTSVTPSFSLGPISASSETGQYVVAGGAGAIYISSDYGATWAASTAPNSSVTYTYSAVNANGQFASIVGGDQIYFSANFGKSWNVTNAPSKTYGPLSTNLDGDHWVTSVSSGRVIVGRKTKRD